MFVGYWWNGYQEKVENVYVYRTKQQIKKDARPKCNQKGSV